MATKKLKKYDIVNGANDQLVTVDAVSAKQAMKIWREKLWHRAPNARGVRARLVRNPRRGGKKKMRSGSKKLAAWVRSQIKGNPRARVKTRVVRKNSTTIKGYKSVTIKKLPDGRVQVTGRK